MTGRACALFDDTDASFDVWYMLTFTGEIDARPIRDGLDQGL